MDRRINNEITKKIKNKLNLNLRQYAEKRNITLSNLKAFISGRRKNAMVWSALVADEIISFTHNNKTGDKYEQS